MKKTFQHLVNLVARVIFFLTKADFLSSFTYGYEDRTATVYLPGTRFAELICTRNGYKPLRFQVGCIDSGTSVLRIDADGIDLKCGDTEWTSSISGFLSHAVFSR
jgi:hypothetical protein